MGTWPQRHDANLVSDRYGHYFSFFTYDFGAKSEHRRHMCDLTRYTIRWLTTCPSSFQLSSGKRRRA